MTLGLFLRKLFQSALVIYPMSPAFFPEKLLREFIEFLGLNWDAKLDKKEV
jgi:hypothetical protein